MTKKQCFKCKTTKPLKEFYAHKQMGDGYLGKCKECTKLDVHNRYSDAESRERVRAYERKRFADPDRKKKVAQYQRNMRTKNKTKYSARNYISNAIRDGRLKRLPCETCGDPISQAHHIDYTKPLAIRWLCFKHHRESHGQIVGNIWKKQI